MSARGSGILLGFLFFSFFDLLLYLFPFLLVSMTNSLGLFAFTVFLNKALPLMSLHLGPPPTSLTP